MSSSASKNIPKRRKVRYDYDAMVKPRFKTLRHKKMMESRSHMMSQTRRRKISQYPRQASTPPKGIPTIFEETSSYSSSKSSSAPSTPRSPIRLNRTTTPESIRFVEMRPVQLPPEVTNTRKTSRIGFYSFIGSIRKSIANMTRRKTQKRT